jgi:hypothetical protein
VRVNNDHTFAMLYRYEGDGTVYRAWFTFTGNHPFANFDGVDLVKYEVAPTNLPPNTSAAFKNDHPNAVVKAVIADHDGNGKFAMIRYTENGGESKWAKADWLDND